MKTASELESEHKWDVVALVSENTALREQLAEVELARDRLSSALSVRDTQLSELRKQLAQVEKERDSARIENERLASQLKEWQEDKDTKAGYL